MNLFHPARFATLLGISTIAFAPIFAQQTERPDTTERPEVKSDESSEPSSSTPEAGDTDEPSNENPRPSSARTYPPYRRVPRYFGQIGLTTQQRSTIYQVRGRYRGEIAELERRIETLKTQEMAECEVVLTDTQRKLLEQRRAVNNVRVSTSSSSSGTDR